MTMNKKWLAAAMILPLALGSVSVFAAGGQKGGDRGDKGGQGCNVEMGDRMFRQLDLTEAQKAEMKTIRNEIKQKGQQRSPEMRANMQGIKAQEQALVLAADFDEAKAQELAASMVEQRTAMQVERMRNQHRMMNVLNEDQKQQLVEMRADKMAKCQQKMGNKNRNNN